jgi:SAM-dependent methyltransferase
VNPRYVLQALLPAAALEAIDAVQILRFALTGRRPWSAGYVAHKRRLIAGVLHDPRLLADFRTGNPLPAGYGVGVDERCVEYPWLIAQLSDRAERVLDAGSVLNHDYLVEHPTIRVKTLHILTLAPEDVCFWQQRISYLFGDLQDIPIRTGYYDTVVCVSTLEHVGFDNAHYTGGPAHAIDHNAHRTVMSELRRVLAPGGTLFLTVPFGTPREFSRMQVFDRPRLDQALAVLGPATHVQTTFFRYSDTGWNVATAEDCADAEFVDRFASGSTGGVDPYRVEPDRAVAARAVACVRVQVV